MTIVGPRSLRATVRAQGMGGFLGHDTTATGSTFISYSEKDKLALHRYVYNVYHTVQRWRGFMQTMPFTVSRQNRTSLIDQVAEGLRSAVVTGHYQVGDTLPNLQEMAAALDVSEIVTRRAVQRLTCEGILNPRRGTGIAVCGTDLKTWRGHVLYLHWGDMRMYYQSVFSGVLTERLHEANVLVSAVHVSQAVAATGFSQVRAELAHVASLAVVEGGAKGLDAILVERNIPFIHYNHVNMESSPQAVRSIAVRRELVLPALRDHSLACGVRSVLDVTAGRGRSFVGPVLEAAGLTVDMLHFEPLHELGNPESVERGALQAVQRWLKSRKKLPDLMWFGDDFVARGALLALTARGVRIPEDVQVMSWSNKGLGPVFLKPLTRVEMDPSAHGEIVARCILERLDGKTSSDGPVELAPEFIEGETTRKSVGE